MTLRNNLNSRVLRNARNRGVRIRNRWMWGTLHPRIYWWRKRNKPHFLLPRKSVDTVVQHITVTFDSGKFTGNFNKDMRTVEKIGWERFGSGVSYNYVIDMETGMVGCGQLLEAKGTHTVNEKGLKYFSYDQNGVAIAIAFLGMPGQVPTRRAVAAWTNLLAALIEEGVVTRTFDFMPHSSFAAKDCPTDAVRELMPKVRLKALTLAKS